MPPAHKGFHRRSLAGDQVNLWLVVHLELIVENGAAQLLHKPEPVTAVVDIVPV